MLYVLLFFTFVHPDCLPKSAGDQYFIFDITLGYFSSPKDGSFGRLPQTKPAKPYPLSAKIRW